MGLSPIRLVIKDYDFLAPLACRDIVPARIDLTLERDTRGALDRTLSDPTIPMGELSFSRHIARLAQGDQSFVGIPLFPYRAFRHRCFFVRRDSGLTDLTDLGGKRIGTNEWPATGTIWSRAALRERGVAIDRIRWWVGSVDGAPSSRPQGNLPAYVQPAPADRTLREMLLTDELDALMLPNPPPGFSQPDSPIVRLYPDYRRVEQAYYQRTGLYPVHHILGVRRPVFDHAPAVIVAVYHALEDSRRIWRKNRAEWAETSPWFLSEIEEVAALMGSGWDQNGTEANHRVIQALCDELFAQGLLSERLTGETVFQEFDRALSDWQTRANVSSKAI